MKTKMIRLALTMLLCGVLTTDVHAQATAFTYQGHFTESGEPFTGNAEFQVTLWDAESGGSAVATNSPTLVVVPVSEGLFTLSLNFGQDPFSSGEDRWLQFEARTTVGPFTELSPRQPLTPTPYAIAAAHITGTIPSNSLSGTYSEAVAFDNAANSFSGDGSGLTGIHSLEAADGTPTDAVFVDTDGHVGIGTTTPMANLEIADTADGDAALIVRSPGGTTGEVHVSGPGGVPGIVGKANNGNRRDIRFSDEGLGLWTSSTAGSPGVGQGLFIDQAGHLGIGTTTPAANLEIVDTADGDAALSVRSPAGTTGSIHISSPGGVPGFIGLANNTNRRDIRFTDSGIALWTSATPSSPPVGNGLFIDQVGRVGIGTASPSAALHVTGSFLAGHPNNSILAGKFGGVVAGGGTQATPNEVRGDYASVLGGSGNLASGDFSVAMGRDATASGSYSAVIGRGAVASGNYAVAMGTNVTADGHSSFAWGRNAQALHDGAFVWSCFDSSNRVFSSDSENVFYARAYGGVKFITGTFLGTISTGARLPPGSSSWESASDRNGKENIEPVDTEALLERLIRIPIQTWNWKTQGDSIRHMGPMAQDFFEAFQVGGDDKHISTVDADGVALAAIQGLNEKVETRNQTSESRMQKLESENAELRAELQKIKRLLLDLTQKGNEL